MINDEKIQVNPDNNRKILDTILPPEDPKKKKKGEYPMTEATTDSELQYFTE